MAQNNGQEFIHKLPQGQLPFALQNGRKAEEHG